MDMHSDQVSATPGQRLSFLDALRGMAALYVVVFHLMNAGLIPIGLAKPSYWQPISFGGTGVFLFFVISGFSLCMTMGRHLASPHPTLSYALSRFFRIAPLYYAMILLSIYPLRVPHAGGPGIYFAFLFNFAPGQQEGIVMASWTIGVEMVFYVLFPALFRVPRAGLVVGSLAVFAAFLAVCGPISAGT